MQYLLTQEEFDALTPKEKANDALWSCNSVSTMRLIERNALLEASKEFIPAERMAEFLRRVSESEWREFQKMPDAFREAHQKMFINPNPNPAT